MRFHRNLPLSIAALILLSSSCGGGGESESKAESEQVDALAQIAMQAMGAADFDQEGADFRQIIEGAGYKTRSYEPFPTQEVGKKGRMLVYQGKKSGGVIYLKKVGDDVSPAWHWYFDGEKPDSVVKVESNDDGLWDVRIVSTDGKATKFVQDESFTLLGAERSDWIAMNGTSSPPIDGDHALWKCFDGDSSTTWESSLGGSGEAFIEVPVPFGVGEGVLTVRTTAEGQPRKCTLYADGKQVQSFELEPKAARQIVRLDPAVKGARTVKVAVESAYGAGDVVSIAELALQ